MTDDEVDDPELLGLRGKTRYGPRWRPVGLRLNESIRLQNEGDLTRADAILAEIVAEATVAAADSDAAASDDTDSDDTDYEALDVLARALGNRAGVAEGRGDLAAALRYAEESLAVCERIMRDTDDRFGIADARTGLLVNRAQTLQALGRPEEALRDLDIAAASVSSPYLSFALHNTRGATLMALERYPEAEIEIRLALDIALESEPRLVAHAYANLGTIAARTGDEQGAAAQLHIARDLRELSGTGTDRAHAELNLGRAAARAGRLAEAQERLLLAQRGYERAGRVLDVAGCQMSRAFVALRQERPRDAADLLDEAIAVLEPAGEIPTLVECHITRAHVTTGDLYRTDEWFLRARELSVGSRDWHQVARIDFLRAQFAVDTAERASTPEERAGLYQVALSLVVTSALATDGFRQRYEPGAMRERWARSVSMPSLALALNVAAVLGHNDLVFQLVEHICATVSLRVSPDDGMDGLEPPRYDAPDMSTRLALPPRLRLLPTDEPAALDWFIDAAEREYRVPIRSADVVRAW